MKHGAQTDIGKRRDINEDAYLTNGAIFAVADGMGGHKAGEVASALALKVLAENLDFEKDIFKTLSSSIKKANKTVYRESVTSPGKHGMGTTLTVVIIKNNKAIIGHIGDSRAYLLRDLKLVQLTRDHSLVAQMVKEGQLTAKEARFHPQRSIITRALGAKEVAEPDIFEFTIKSKDRVLLTTDGLTSMLADAEILKILIQNLEPQAACNLLVDEANKRGGLDNITVVLIDFDEADITTANPSSLKKQGGRAKTFFFLGALAIIAITFLYVFLGRYVSLVK
ncbi:MAG TPA: Stp1/IreP family PP2C-type Ser/Thr phosphatase [Actinobacteria bacterium]|nr:Stp1/IreP family PP2C-type Ser/Thr phosphatase [Actinomycetota bacterium]